jgi:hypothetical protein
MWKKLHSACDAFGPGFCSIDAVAPVVFRCAAKIPAIDTVDSSSAAAVWSFVNEDFRAGRRERSFVVIECSVELCFSGESRIDAGWAHEV